MERFNYSRRHNNGYNKCSEGSKMEKKMNEYIIGKMSNGIYNIETENF